jgi:hypothetical protein
MKKDQKIIKSKAIVQRVEEREDNLTDKLYQQT